MKKILICLVAALFFAATVIYATGHAPADQEEIYDEEGPEQTMMMDEEQEWISEDMNEQDDYMHEQMAPTEEDMPYDEEYQETEYLQDTEETE